MSHDLTIKYIVKIEAFGNSGTGVIFKTDKRSDVFYVLTAKHNFSNEVCSSIIKKEDIKIYREIDSNVNIVNDDIHLLILENQTIDICLLVIQKERTNINNELEIHYLEVFDMDYYSIQKLDFFISGYPSFSSGIDRSSKLVPYTLQHMQFESDDNITARLSCKSTHIISPTNRSGMKGISGAGVFVQENKYTVNLSHINHDAPGLNLFLATRLDLFVDEFNDLIIKLNAKLPLLKTNTHVIIEDMSIEEFGNFSFLEEKIYKDIITHEKIIDKYFPFNATGKIDDRSRITKTNSELNKIHNKVNEIANSLSYLYVYYAVSAHKEKKRRLTSLFFKKAIELNPIHKNIFIQEKAARANNVEQIQKMAALSLIDTIKFYEKTIEESDGNLTKIAKTKDAINALMKFEKDEDQDREIRKYFDLLENLYQENITLREQYKYKELGEFYINIHQYKKAFEFLYIACFLLEESPPSDINLLMVEELKIVLSTLEENIDNVENIKAKLQIKAKEALLKSEDITIKEHVKNSSTMIRAIYDDIYQIKQADYKRNELTMSFQSTLTSLKSKIEKQIAQNEIHNIDTTLINENILKLDLLNVVLSNQINDIPEKYDVQIDDKTRNELLNIADEPLLKASTVLQKLSETSLKIDTHINNAEKSLEVLTDLGKKELEDFSQQAQTTLKAASGYYQKLLDEKNELLVFLGRLEQRVINSLRQSFTTDQEQSNAIRLLRESIAHLNRNLKEIGFSNVPSRNQSLYLSKQKSMADIQYACLELENKLTKIINEHNTLQTQTITSSIDQNQTTFLERVKFETDQFIQSNHEKIQALIDTQSRQTLALQQNLANQQTWIDQLEQSDKRLQNIQSSQLRFEHKLLEKAKEALSKHPETVTPELIKPYLSFEKKVLFGIYLIIFIGCVTYLVIHNGLLDLLIHLWQTARQNTNS